MEKILEEIIDKINEYNTFEFEFSKEEMKKDKEDIIEKVKNKKDIELAYTTDENDKNEFEVFINLKTLKLMYLVNNKIVKEEKFKDLNEVLEYVSDMDFDSLVDDDNFPGFSKYNDFE